MLTVCINHEDEEVTHHKKRTKKNRGRSKKASDLYVENMQIGRLANVHFGSSLLNNLSIIVIQCCIKNILSHNLIW
jgi:hypothetical protein